MCVCVKIRKAKKERTKTVDRSKITFASMSESTLLQELLRTISVPNMNVLLLKYTIVRTSGDEPKQFLGNTSPENTFRRQDGNDIVAKTVSHGRTELGNSTCTRTCVRVRSASEVFVPFQCVFSSFVNTAYDLDE